MKPIRIIEIIIGIVIVCLLVFFIMQNIVEGHKTWSTSFIVLFVFNVIVLYFLFTDDTKNKIK